MWIKRTEYLTLYGLNATLAAQVMALDLQVLELQKRGQELAEALAAERARSDNAVDRLLNMKGLPGVTPTKHATLDDITGMFAEDEEAVAAVRKAIAEHGLEQTLADSVK